MLISLSGTTLLGRGWDGGMETDPNDPEWNLISAAFDKSFKVKRGKGYSRFLDLNSKLASRLLADLLETAELYLYDNDPINTQWAKAYLKDAKKIELNINLDQADVYSA